MTIQFLRAWNGNEQFSVATLSGSEETRLVGLGLARPWYGPDDPSPPAGAPYAIQGAMLVGSTLTLAITQGYRVQTGQWYRDGAAIAGATALAYQLQVLDVQKPIAFEAANIGYRAQAVGLPRAPAAAPGIALPSVMFVKQSFRIIDQSPIARLLHRSSPRNSVVVRNTGATVLQIGFTTNNNNNNNSPASWTDIAVGEEFYEGDVDHQIWARAKNAGETVYAQVEVETPRI